MKRKSEYEDLNNAYHEVRKRFPEEVAVFCCDLGDRWFFNFLPKEHTDGGWVTGHFGTTINKENGKIELYDVFANMPEFQDKVNLTETLK